MKINKEVKFEFKLIICFYFKIFFLKSFIINFKNGIFNFFVICLGDMVFFLVNEKLF